MTARPPALQKGGPTRSEVGPSCQPGSASGFPGAREVQQRVKALPLQAPPGPSRPGSAARSGTLGDQLGREHLPDEYVGSETTPGAARNSSSLRRLPLGCLGIWGRGTPHLMLTDGAVTCSEPRATASAVRPWACGSPCTEASSLVK